VLGSHFQISLLAVCG